MKVTGLSTEWSIELGVRWKVGEDRLLLTDTTESTVKRNSAAPTSVSRTNAPTGDHAESALLQSSSATPTPDGDSDQANVGPNDRSLARTTDRVLPRRTPDLKSSRERLALVDILQRELAIIKKEVNGYCTVEGLKRKYPTFTVWSHLEDWQLKALVDGEEFAPKAYAENLTLMKFGLTSRETLKKDRRKLRKAKEASQK
jgi:hypothetical protein